MPTVYRRRMWTLSLQSEAKVNYYLSCCPTGEGLVKPVVQDNICAQ